MSFISPSFAASSDADELTDFLDELLAEDELPTDQEPDPEAENDPEADPTTQTAEEIQDELNKKENEANKSDAEKLLDDEIGEDHDSAQEILDEDERWTYSSGDDESTISINKINDTNAEIHVSKVLFDGTAVDNYRVYYSEKSLASQSLSLIKDTVVKKIDDSANPDTVHLNLKWLSPDTKYYVVVSPVHPEDDSIEPLEVITKEVTFKTSAKVVEPKEEEKKEEVKEEPKEEEKEEPKKYLTDVKTANTDNEVVLTRWTTMTDVKNVEVSLRHSTEDKYTTLTTADYSKGTFTFLVTKKGTYFIKLKALDKDGEILWEERTTNVNVAKIIDPSKSDEPVVANPPKVWPTTDLLIGLLIFSMIMYMMMRFRGSKRY